MCTKCQETKNIKCFSKQKDKACGYGEDNSYIGNLEKQGKIY